MATFDWTEIGIAGSGDVVLQLKSAWRDGTTHIKMSPLEFMQRLAALVQRPRLHLIRFHGVLASNAGLRAAIVPGSPKNTSVPADEHARGAPARIGWARLLKRVFDIDLEHCPHCGGDLKIIAAIEEPAVIVRILTHLGLPARAHRAHRRGRWRCFMRPDPQIKSGSATGRGPRSQEATQWRRVGLFADDAEVEKCRREQRFHETLARLTACRTGDRVADSEKRYLNFLFAFEDRHLAIMEGEKAGLAAIAAIKQKIAEKTVGVPVSR